MRFLFTLCLLVMIVLPAVGQQRRSSGIAPSSQAMAQQAQAIRELEYSVQRLAARFDVIEQQQSALASRITSLEQGKNTATKDDIAALRADLNAVRASQEQMRGEIVDDLSKKLATLAKQREEAERKAHAAATQKSGYKHTVEAGQTISAIADAYGVSVRSIIKANKISDPSKIRVGQVLLIPDP